MFNAFIASIFILFVLVILLYVGIRLYEKKVPIWQYPIALLYGLWLLFFLLFGSLFSAEYAEAIDPIDDNYTFISGQYRLTFLIFFLLYHIALWTLWVRKAKLPPLPLVLCLCFLYIGIAINVAIASQLLGENHREEELASFPIFSSLIAILVIRRTLMAVREELSVKTFKNRWLNKLNLLLSSRFTVLTWSVLLVFPNLCTYHTLTYDFWPRL